MSDQPDRVFAPWTPEQVEALWLYQMARFMHPFTCGNRSDHPEIMGDNGVLIPTVRGWVCMFCDYTQDWAHPFMTDLEGVRRAHAVHEQIVKRW